MSHRSSRLPSIARLQACDETATEGDITAYIEDASPEQLATLRNLDNDFEIEMRRLGVEEYGIEVKDRKSARLMADKRPQIILSGVYTVGYFTLIVGLLTGIFKIPIDGRDLIIGLIVLQFFQHPFQRKVFVA
ncbi:MAG TPA: hypothetical protein EYQ14_10605 [Gammaproteobacteria bacterium]|nr:hypothetical protein [Gammaproteobacteria bacterium]HIL97824.1 hypothetical protein [Pseudomonadales bacterium]